MAGILKRNSLQKYIQLIIRTQEICQITNEIEIAKEPNPEPEHSIFIDC